MDIQRESIFISAIRSFCKMFFAVCGLFLAFIVMSLLYGAISDETTIETKTKIKHLPDANWNRDTSATAPVVLQINIHGVIGDPTNIDSNSIQNILLDSRTGTFKGDRVKAILLHFNTPGGTVVDSDNIYRMLKDYKERYKVPIYAYIDGLCASGGVYAACAADQIYAGNASLIGSVGVILGPFFNVFETMNKWGVTSRTITEGLNKDMMSPFRPWKENEDASLKAATAFFYDQFVEIVTTNRPKMNKEQLVKVLGAQVYDPVQARNYGYIDFANATREEALLALLKAANIDATKAYQVIQLEAKSEWLSNLLTKSPLTSGKIEHSLDTGMPQIRDKFAYLYQP